MLQLVKVRHVFEGLVSGYFPQVHGVGEELDVKIGQRKKLSDLDIAQIKDIYYCNQKDARDKGLGTCLFNKSILFSRVLN